MIFRQKAMLRTAIRPKRKVVAGRTLGNGVARRGYCGVSVDDFRASFPLSGMTLSVVLGRTPWRATRGSYTDYREYMSLPPFVNPRPAEDVPDAAGGAMPPSAWAAAGFRSSAAAEERIFRNCILAGLRPAGSHCKNNLILTSGSIPHLRLGVSCKERIYHLLSPKGGAKSVRRAPTSGSDGAMRNLRCTARNDDYLLISYFSRSPACRIALRKERKDSYAPLHSVRNDKSCHPQEEVQTNSDTGIAPCIAPQTAEKKAVSDRFSAHLPENRKIIRNFAGQSINCRARI